MKNWKKDFYAKYSSYFKREFDKSSYNGFEPYGIHIMNIAFPKEKNINIVDLACGIGGYLNIFKSKGYENILGVDTSEEEVEYAHKNELLEVKQGDIFKFFEKSVSKTYDIVIALDIIEHLETDELLIFLKESHRILKKDRKSVV